MAYGAISTLSSGGTLSHTHLNLLQSNSEFLRDIALRANWPCPAVHRTSIGGFTVADHHFFFRHWNRYLRFQIENLSNTVDQIRVFFNGRLVFANEAPTTPLTDVVDLHTITTWPTYVGAWATATGYDDNSGTNTDGDIVSHGGAYYVCAADHTSGASTEPGVGASWDTVWDLIAIPTLGAWHKCYFYVTFVSGLGELAINYVYEATSP